MSVASLAPLPLGSVDRRNLIAGCRDEQDEGGGGGRGAPTRRELGEENTKIRMFES